MKGEKKLIYRLLSYVVILSMVVLVACESNREIDSIINPILSEFKEAGITLDEKNDKSQTFIFSGSNEKQYEFPGGSIYVIYNFDNKEMIIEKLTVVFAESEFPYGVKELYTDKFIIIFIANSENLDVEKKIEFIFQKFKDI